jgi:hypothetical protein
MSVSLGNLKPATATGTPTAVTSLTPPGPIQRNATVAATLAEMAQQAQQGGASSTKLRFAKGVVAEGFEFNYHSGLAKQVNITKAPADKILRATVCINVSGHDQTPGSVDRFAATNTYNVRVRLPDGKELVLNNVARNNPNSKEYATAIDIQIPYMKGETIVQAWPTGSAGVAGYTEGREYHLHCEEGFYDAKKALKDAQATDASHASDANWVSQRPFQDF